MTGPVALDLGFDPAEPVTITLPRGIIHGLAGAAWTEDIDMHRYARHVGQEYLARQVDVKTVDAQIRARLVASIPPLDSFIGPLRDALRHAVDLYRNGSREGVSHLGAGWATPPPPVVPGWVSVSVLPGMPHIIVRRAELSWRHSLVAEAKWTEDDARRIAEIASEFAPVASTWNDTTNHLGIRLDLPTRARQ